jgi:hypothetical protein
VWDLNKVSPLFRVPSCVLFGIKAEHLEGKIEREKTKQKLLDSYQKTGISGREFSGALSIHNCNWNYAEKLLSEKAVTYFYLNQGNSSAFSKRSTGSQLTNPYRKLFKQGATIVPRTFYFVELNQGPPSDFKDRVINVKTAHDVLYDAKAPWKIYTFADRIESNFLFLTALGRSILPFSLFNPSLNVLPIFISTSGLGNKEIVLTSPKNLLSKGFVHASRWFKKTEKLWDENKTEKNEPYSAIAYLNWQNKLTDQNLNAPYLVVYNGRGKDTCATVVIRESLDFEFVVDHANYSIAFSDLQEAYYLSAILNSSTPNKMMKDFQSTGLYGERNIHKKILDIYFPRFERKNEIHLKLSELSDDAHQKVASYLLLNPPQDNLTARYLGRLRHDIKQYLSRELSEIDSLVEQLLKSS